MKAQLWLIQQAPGSSSQSISEQHRLQRHLRYHLLRRKRALSVGASIFNQHVQIIAGGLRLRTTGCCRVNQCVEVSWLLLLLLLWLCHDFDPFLSTGGELTSANGFGLIWRKRTVAHRLHKCLRTCKPQLAVFQNHSMLF